MKAHRPRTLLNRRRLPNHHSHLSHPTRAHPAPFQFFHLHVRNASWHLPHSREAPSPAKHQNSAPLGEVKTPLPDLGRPKKEVSNPAFLPKPELKGDGGPERRELSSKIFLPKSKEDRENPDESGDGGRGTPESFNGR